MRSYFKTWIKAFKLFPILLAAELDVMAQSAKERAEGYESSQYWKGYEQGVEDARKGLK